MSEKQTPLYNCHIKHKGKLVPFAGYVLPIQYPPGIVAEHMAVRTKAGLFDVSHMGEILLSGKNALENIQRLVTADCSKMRDGMVKYSPMCNHDGGIVDDVLIYRKNEQAYMIVVNACNHEKDAKWIQENLTGDVQFTDISNSIAQIALQGPLAGQILKRLCKEEHIPQKNFNFIENGCVAGVSCMISRTGYTGEDGFELYVDISKGNASDKENPAETLWNALIKTGEPLGLLPCGLGARDTLRLEAGMPLYGHEMDHTISPLETGLSFFVKMDKADFIGKEALERRGTPKVKRVGLKLIDRGIAREDAEVFVGDERIGHVTSGTHCPYINHAMAMAILTDTYTEIGNKVTVEVRGRKLQAEVVELPFYKRKK